MEVTVVMVLASIVMLALLGFYINSQAIWTDASSQAITQREMTAVVARLTEQAHAAASAQLSSPGGMQAVTFYDQKGAMLYGLSWGEDSLIHVVNDPWIPGSPAIGRSPVTKFQLVVSESLVTLVALEMRTPTGRLTSLHTSVRMLNAPVGP